MDSLRFIAPILKTVSLSLIKQLAAGEFALPPLLTSVKPEIMLGNMRSSLERNLPALKVCKPHNLILSVAGGGPSLADTVKDLTGYIATINGSLKFLLSQPIVNGSPYFCGVMDPNEHIADGLVDDCNIRYYVASICHPAVFDKLKNCHVVLWHTTPISTGDEAGATDILKAYSKDWMAVGGGCTMGLRWINLGYVLGFRNFNLHGLDSSFRGSKTHAYPDRADKKNHLTVDGRETRLNFLAQVRDFLSVLETLQKPGFDRTEIKVFGEGLLQDTVRIKNADLLCQAGK